MLGTARRNDPASGGRCVVSGLRAPSDRERGLAASSVLATCVPRPLPGGGRRGACSPVCLAPCMCVRAACVHTCAQVCVLTPCVCACVCAPSCAYLRVCAHVMCARVCSGCVRTRACVCLRWRLRRPHRGPQEFRRHLGPQGGAPRSAVGENASCRLLRQNFSL